MIDRRIISNALFLGCSDVAIRAASAIASLLVARQIGANRYGALALAVSIGLFASYLTDLGLTDTYIREGSRHEADAGALLRTALRLRLMLAAAVTLLVATVGAVVYPPNLQLLVLITVVPMVWGETLQSAGSAFFSLKQTMQYSALIRGLSGAISIVLLLSAATLGASLPWLGAAYGASSLAAGLVALLLVRRSIGRTGNRAAGLLGGLGHFAAAGLLNAALPQMGALILERVSGLTSVAFYAAAFRVPALLMQVPRTISAAFYPSLFQSGLHDRAQHLRLMGDSVGLNLVIGVGLTLPVALYSNTIIAMLLGNAWLPVSGTVLSLLAWTVLLRAASAPLADGAVTLGRVAMRSKLLCVQGALAVPLYVVLGYYAGAVGAAIATLALETLLLIAFVVVTPSAWALLWKGLSAGVLVPAAAAVLVRVVAGSGPTSLVLAAPAYAMSALLLHRDLRPSLLRLNALRASRGAGATSGNSSETKHGRRR